MKFEVWKHGTEDRQMIEGKHVGDGKYVARYTFAAKGTYSVVAHVTAKICIICQNRCSCRINGGKYSPFFHIYRKMDEWGRAYVDEGGSNCVCICRNGRWGWICDRKRNCAIFTQYGAIGFVTIAASGGLFIFSGRV